jgi:uncharacterized repeat protein (TIGR01451 family)
MKRLLYLVAVSVAAVLTLAPAALAQTDGLSCIDFANQETAQAILDANPGDPYNFDVDGDAIACEDLGDTTAEDGTLAPFGQYAQVGYAGGAPAQLAETGGPPLLILVAVAMLLLGIRFVMATFAVGERGSRVGALAWSQQAPMSVGANGKRLVLIVLAAALAILLAIMLGTGAVWTTKSASAQGSNPLAISTAVYPSPTNAIPLGTKMDFLITEYNASNRPARKVTVSDQLPAGVSYVAAKASQGQCYPMADEPTIRCNLGTIPAKGVAHINVVVHATSRGTHSNYVYDKLGNEASARFTIVRR